MITAPAPARHGQVRLFIEILVNGHRSAGLYKLMPIPGCPGSWRIKTQTGQEHQVHRAPNGTLSCDCPDAVYRARPGGCKHCRAIKAAGL